MQAQVSNASITLEFEHFANNGILHKYDSTLKGPGNEKYLVSKLKYYISHISLKGAEVHTDLTPRLIEVGKNQQVHLSVPPGHYEHLEFMLGLDSLLHCSGAQSGDLDPLYDMFWTWNSGYVIFKLEGRYFSPDGKSGRLEHHLGGYREDQQISKMIDFKLPEPLNIKEAESRTIKIGLDLDKYWAGKETVSPVSEPVITKPGKNAVRIAENFGGLFHLIIQP
jgi:hypothetical protein